MRVLAKYSIVFYQKFISPYKGFRCAYGAYYGHSSCSCEIMNIIENEPFSECKKALSLIDNKNQKRRKIFKRKRDKDKWYDCFDLSAACDIFDVCSLVKKAGRAGGGVDCCDCNPF